MNKQQALNDLIRRVYKTAADTTEWEPLLQTLADGLRSQVVAFMEQHQRTGQGVGQYCLGLDDATIDSYEQYYGPRSELFHDFKALEPGVIFTEEMSSNLDQYLGSETYNDYCVKNKIEHTAAFSLDKDSDWLSLMVLRRPAEVGVYTQAEVETLNLLTPHLMQATQIARELQRKDLLSMAFGEAFNNLPVGVVVLSRPNSVVFNNDYAEQLFRSGLFVSGLGGQLRAVSTAADSLMQQVIQEAFELGKCDAISTPKPVFIRNHDFASPCMVRVMPLIQELLSVHNSNEFVLCLINDPQQVVTIETEALMDCCQLTFKEAQITVHLCQGLKPEKIAEVTHTSVNTVRTHIKSTLQKTSTNTQTQLVSKVYTELMPAFGALARK